MLLVLLAQALVLQPGSTSWLQVPEPLPTPPCSPNVHLLWLLLLLRWLLLLLVLLQLPSGPLLPTAARALKAVSQDAMKAIDPLAVACEGCTRQQGRTA
jgi:hypothetical protein